MSITEKTVQSAKHSNAVNTGAPDSGKITITKDFEKWKNFANGLNILLANSIPEIEHLSYENVADVQTAAYFSQELDLLLLQHYPKGGE
jgi:hypothetical protein